MSDTPRNDKLTAQAVGCSDALHLVLVDELSRNLERELAEVRKHLRVANRGAEVNAKVNQLLVNELAEARRQVARAEELLVAAEEWMSADGCDCGTDEIDACSLCRIRAFLAAAQQAKEGGK